MNDIQQQAQIALSAKNCGDPRYNILVQRLSERLNMNADQVEQNIMLLVMGFNI